jgi:apolipoprotein D and lipocalin family protein
MLLSSAPDGKPEVRAVAAVDLARYAGRWYEIGRLPNRFQRRCACCVTASYALEGDGRISVVNECRAGDGERIRAAGVARLADRDGPASKLKVRFAPRLLSFLPFVWGDYWVLDLADDYSFALVGEPKRKYLWVLSRTPTLSEERYRALLDAAKSMGYDTDRVVRTPHPPSDVSP